MLSRQRVSCKVTLAHCRVVWHVKSHATRSPQAAGPRGARGARPRPRQSAVGRAKPLAFLRDALWCMQYGEMGTSPRLWIDEIENREWMIRLHGLISAFDFPSALHGVPHVRYAHCLLFALSGCTLNAVKSSTKFLLIRSLVQCCTLPPGQASPQPCLW